MNGIVRVDAQQGIAAIKKKTLTSHASPSNKAGHHNPSSRASKPTLTHNAAHAVNHNTQPSLVSNAMTSLIGWDKDATDNLLELEYKDEIFEYMKQMERETMAVPEHMDLQPELTWDLRPLLVDFLIEIHNHFNLQPETLYLAMNMMDRYLSKRVVYKKHYQLVGMTSLWISSKYEDSKEKLPSVSQLCKLCSNTYDEAAFITMERHILKTLDYGLGHPTAEAFMKKDLELSGQGQSQSQSQEDQVLRHVAQFLMELTMFQRCFLSFGSSTIAASALFLARTICRKPVVVPNDPNVFTCVQYLDNSLINVSKIVHEKYARSRLSQASIVVKDWVDNGGRASMQPMSSMSVSGDCSTPLWTLSSMLWQPPSPIPTAFPTQAGIGHPPAGSAESQAQCQTQSQSGHSHAGYSASQQQQPQSQPQQQQQPTQSRHHHAQSQQQQQPMHHMHANRHHSHSVSSISSQYSSSSNHHHHRSGSSVSTHLAALVATLPQQPQPAVITHQTTYDIRPAGSDCGGRWVDINVNM
ncbi:hypothetical protein BGZ75_004520 [Mortierella antarctica]|nr:hypothetical protein BGZ67_005810 [Mortierella alpina]KAF9983930.1 hypothetical protein BGZ75_004520 [Mortierella antarctica]